MDSKSIKEFQELYKTETGGIILSAEQAAVKGRNLVLLVKALIGDLEKENKKKHGQEK